MLETDECFFSFSCVFFSVDTLKILGSCFSDCQIMFLVIVSLVGMLSR